MEKIARKIITIEKILQLTAIAGVMMFSAYMGFEVIRTRNFSPQTPNTSPSPEDVAPVNTKGSN